MRPIAEIEQDLATLRAERDGLPPLLAEAEAAVAAAERPLEEARRIYEAAGVERVATLPAPDLLAVWRTPEVSEVHAERQREAEAGWRQADEDLQQALITRNTLDGRRGALLGRRRFLEAQIEQREAELARAQQVAEQNPNRLAGLRQRLGLGG